MTDTELTDLAIRGADDLVVRLLPLVFEPLQGPAEGPEEQRRALAQLHLLTFLRQAVDRLKDEAAHRAADAGAGYPQIGRAANMTRQGARRRWPGLTDHRPTATEVPATEVPSTQSGSTP